MDKPMSYTERMEAARAMAGSGPWQFQHKHGSEWYDVPDGKAPTWNWSTKRYRIKPATTPTLNATERAVLTCAAQILESKDYPGTAAVIGTVLREL